MLTHTTVRRSPRILASLTVMVALLGGCAKQSGSMPDAMGVPATAGAERAPLDDGLESHPSADPGAAEIPLEDMEDSELEADEAAPMSIAPAGERSGKGRAHARRMNKSKESKKMGRRNRAVASAGSIARPQPQIAAPPPPADPEFNTESYQHISENDFLAVADKPLSTFSIDVDTASYSNTRRFLTDGALPPPDAVRIEEMLNYFSYDYADPTGNHPFGVTTEVGDCPWNADARLVHVGVQGKKLNQGEVPPRNLVFLLDVSGSMDSRDKLPLLKKAMMMLARNLDRQDRVSIVVYAGASGVVLRPTSSKQKIRDAIGQLGAGGSTNGGEGIELAYALARKNFDPNGINRVILATDGDFNIGTTSHGDLTRLIEKERESGVFLSVLGFGTGNVKDSTMEMLADKGNGNYAYIDSEAEARKVLVEEAGSTLVTIAKDVKIQVEFNPALVAKYRLIGYENRALADRDFNDDRKDAGEIGAGHTVTALYEVIPTSRARSHKEVDDLRFQKKPVLSAAASSNEMMHLKLRYKQPKGQKSTLVSFPIQDRGTELDRTSDDFRFAAAVAQFAMLLRGSKFVGQTSFKDARRLARGALGRDDGGWRRQFLGLVDKAGQLHGEKGLSIAR